MIRNLSHRFAYFKAMYRQNYIHRIVFPVILCVHFLGIGAYAQENNSWQNQLQDVNISSEEVRQNFGLTWPELDAVPRSNGKKPFERWAWWTERRTKPHGTRPPSKAWWDASQELKQTLLYPSSGPSWSYIGNEDIPVYGGAGRVNNIVVFDGGWLACAPSGGLWLSDDEGESWNTAGGGVDELSAVGTTDVIVDPDNPNHWFLATGDGDGATTYSIGLLETFDSGANWTTTGLAMPEGNQKIFKIAFQPGSPNVVYVCSSTGLYRSEDAGVSFNSLKTGIVRDMVIHTDSTHILTIALDNVGVYRSVDSGLSWTNIPLPQSEGLGRMELASSVSHPDRIYAFVANYFAQSTMGVWRSDDGGVSFYPTMLRAEGGPNLHGWTSDGSDYSGQAWWDMCIAVDPFDENKIVLGGVNLWESNDGGYSWNCEAHWSGQGEYPQVHADQHGLTFLSDGRLLVANDGGVYLRDGSGQYADKSDGLDIAQIYRLGLSPHKHSDLICGTQDNGTSLYNQDGWQRILDGDGMGCFFHHLDSNILFMSAYYGLLYRSTDAGRSNTQIANYSGFGINEVGNWLTPWLASPHNPEIIYVGKKSVYRSDDAGDTWSTLGTMSDTKADAIALSATDPNMILVAKRDELWRSTNGYDFTALLNLPDETIGDVLISSSDSNEIWVCFGSYTNAMQVWVSYDGGGSWEDKSLGLQALPVNTLVESPDGTIYAGTDLGVYAYDEVSGWSIYGDGLPLTIITDLEIRTATNRLVAASYGRGVWEVELPSLPSLDLTALGLDDFDKLQCNWEFTCAPTFLNSGTDPVFSVKYAVNWDANEAVILHHFTTPLNPNETIVLPLSSHQVDSTGTRIISIHILEVNGGLDEMDNNNSVYESCTVSGLGYRGTLTEWAGCNAEDLRWSLAFEGESSNILESTPIPAGDTLTRILCLPEGCLVLQWDDEDGDGWLDTYCAEAGGFVWLSPFDEVLATSVNSVFSTTNSFSHCVDTPWCYSDFDGDGERTVTDLLWVLSEYGCLSGCTADLNGDGLVTVIDLMNLLSSYGVSCY